MFALLAKIIPLGFASALSPGILALVVYMMGKKHARPRIFAMFCASIIVVAAIIVLGFLAGSTTTKSGEPTTVSSIIDITFGVLFLYFALKELLNKERKLKESQEDLGPQFMKWFIIGFLINVTNFDAVFLAFTSAKEIGSAEINILNKIIAAIINAFFFSLPVTLPVIIYLMMPKIATVALAKLNRFLVRYSKYIIFAMFAIFGVIFLYRGIKFFM